MVQEPHQGRTPWKKIFCQRSLAWFPLCQSFCWIENVFWEDCHHVNSGIHIAHSKMSLRSSSLFVVDSSIYKMRCSWYSPQRQQATSRQQANKNELRLLWEDHCCYPLKSVWRAVKKKKSGQLMKVPPLCSGVLLFCGSFSSPLMLNIRNQIVSVTHGCSTALVVLTRICKPITSRLLFTVPLAC